MYLLPLVRALALTDVVNPYSLTEEIKMSEIQEEGFSSQAAQQNNAQPRQNPEVRQAPKNDLGLGTSLQQLSALSAVRASANTAAGSTKEVMETLEKVMARIENVPAAIKPALTPIESNDLLISAIAISLEFKNTLYYSVLLFESLGVPIQNAELPSYGRNIPVDRSTSDYWDPVMTSITESILTNKFPSSSREHVTCTAHIVVPGHIDLKSEEKLAYFYDHCIASLMCDIKLINGEPSHDPSFKPALLSSRNLLLNAKFDFTPGATYQSTTGEPILADFNAILYARDASKVNALNQSSHNVGGDICLTSAMGYVDFIRCQPMQIQYGQQTVPGYYPVIVLTQLSTLSKAGTAKTLDDNLLSFLLSLPLVLPLADSNQRWVQVFEPTLAGAGNKPSIGHLALEHNVYPGQQHKPQSLPILPGNDVSNDPNRLTARQMAQYYCLPSVMVALDYKQGGPLEWLHRILVEATPGSVAEQLIIRELDIFSGGAFGKIWADMKQPICSAEHTYLHAGYFTAPNGNQCDIRSVDYLSVLESSEGDLSTINAFAAGFYPGTTDYERMYAKRKFLETVAPTFKCTGLNTRVFINNNFISAIDQMLSQVGLSFTLEGFNDINGIGGQRPMLNAQYLTPMTSHGTFGFNRLNQQQMQGRNLFGNSSYHNWGR